MADILRCEGLQNSTKVFLVNGEVLISSCNIGVYRKGLERYGFFTCHKSHLVNTQFITRYLKDGHLEIEDGTLLPLARRKKEEFFDHVLKEFDLVNCIGKNGK